MKIAIIGYGRMGKTIERLAVAKGHEIVLKINIDNIEEFTTENLKKAEVAIEFSQPESAFENIKKCLEAGLPIVSGTTAWLDKLDEAKAICTENNGGFMYASNFSIGVNIFFEVNNYLAKMMNPQTQYEPSLHEVHHTKKLDAPSGTGITLAEGVLKNIDRKESWVNRSIEQLTELALTSERIDPAPGTHVIAYNSDIDTIEIKHTAHSREGFASGAILAAEWIIGKKGCFTMREVLGFK
ncbi:MAG: 4-hydroxy-tetrahydrodipicolinate reductase [Saprospiraceae bacterium]